MQLVHICSSTTGYFSFQPLLYAIPKLIRSLFLHRQLPAFRSVVGTSKEEVVGVVRFVVIQLGGIVVVGEYSAPVYGFPVS